MTDEKHDQERAEEGPAPGPTVVARRDELGQPIERVEAASPEAAVHWDEAAWHSGGFGR